jgi:hypothetical protein
MYLHIERWTARSAWLALPLRDRIDYLDQMGPEIQRLREAGVRLVGMVLKDTSTSDEGLYYHAAWSMPEGPPQVQRLRAVLDAFNWHRYFRPATDRSERSARKTLFDYAEEEARRVQLSGARRN